VFIRIANVIYILLQPSFIIIVECEFFLVENPTKMRLYGLGMDKNHTHHTGNLTISEADAILREVGYWMNKQLLAQAIQAKRATNGIHFECLVCTKSEVEQRKAEVIKAHPLQEVSFICLFRRPSE